MINSLIHSICDRGGKSVGKLIYFPPKYISFELLSKPRPIN
jgi:hypothetical protein